ncbi:MAG: hypothetical protein KTR28_03780 [Micavibrio sp.]|nr:hypothetical protein [Micavibrio sp.]
MHFDASLSALLSKRKIIYKQGNIKWGKAPPKRIFHPFNDNGITAHRIGGIPLACFFDLKAGKTYLLSGGLLGND